MKDVTAARRYAKALYDLAEKSGSLDDVMQAMSNIKIAIQSSPELKRVLINPLITAEEKRVLVKTITSNKLILRFVDLLARRGRLELLSVIHDQLLELSDRAKGIHRVLVKTAIALTEAQKRLVESQLADRFGGRVIGHFQQAKEMIGGVWVKLGDKVLDATLRGRIDDLKHALANSAN